MQIVRYSILNNNLIIIDCTQTEISYILDLEALYVFTSTYISSYVDADACRHLKDAETL